MKLTSYGLIIVYSSCLYILWNNDLSAFYLLNTICSGTSACDYKVNGKHDIAKKKNPLKEKERLRKSGLSLRIICLKYLKPVLFVLNFLNSLFFPSKENKVKKKKNKILQNLFLPQTLNRTFFWQVSKWKIVSVYECPVSPGQPSLPALFTGQRQENKCVCVCTQWKSKQWDQKHFKHLSWAIQRVALP